VRNVRVLAFSVLVFVIDQATKVLARLYLQEEGSVSVIGNFFRLTYAENPGIAFGIQLGNKTLFTILIGIASLAILYYLNKIRGELFPARFALALIFGGALGNLLDRIAFGKVVDFLDFEFFDFIMHRWPVFNVADMAITIGMVILIVIVLLDRGQDQEKQATKSDGETSESV